MMLRRTIQITNNNTYQIKAHPGEAKVPYKIAVKKKIITIVYV